MATSARGAADAMDVDLRIFGHVVIDHVTDVINIKSARGKVTCNQHSQRAAAELIHHLVALGLVHVAVHGVRINAVLGQVFGYLIDGLLHATEDDGQGRFFVFQQVMQEFSLIPRLNREPTLIDRGHRETLLGGDDLLRALHVAAGEFLNLRADGCTDKDRLRALLHGAEDLADVLPETNVKHAIHFVQDHYLELVVRQQAALVHVHDATRRSNDDLWVALQRLRLRAHRLAAVHRNSLNSSVSAEFLNFAADLDCQFAGRYQHQRAELVAGLQ